MMSNSLSDQHRDRSNAHTHSAPANHQWSAQQLSLWLGVFAFVGGASSFAGWAANVPRLADWDGDGIAIQPNASIAVTFAAIALILLIKGFPRIAAVFGGLVAFIGASVLVEYATHVEFGIDSLFLFNRAWGQVGVSNPGRMGPPGATSWALLGIALILGAITQNDRRTRSFLRTFVPYLSLGTVAIASLSVVGYLYGATTLYTLPRLTAIAFQTGVFILAISLGLIMSVPDRGLMRLILARNPAGTLTRRTLPALIAVPLVIGFVRVLGQRADLYDAAFGSALRTIIEIGLLLTLFWWTAKAIAHQIEQREMAERALRENEKRIATDLDAMRLLQEIGVRCSRAGNQFEDCINDILDAAIAIAGAQKGNVQLFEANSRVLKIAAHRGFEEPFLDFFRVVVGEDAAACGAAMASGARVVVEDVANSEIFRGQSSLDVLLAEGVHAVQSTPLVSSTGNLLGMISTHFSEPHRVSERESRLIDLLARQAADYLERKGSEAEREQLFARERDMRATAESANRIKDEFLATVSHELRTPLNAILGWATMIRSGKMDQETSDRAIEAIERNARSQAQLIEDLLDVSRIISGKMRLDVRPISLTPVIKAALDSVRPAAEAKQIQLRMTIDSAADELAADQARTQQVIWNLLANAVKFTSRGGNVLVRTSRVNGLIEIAVIDDGEGISEEFLPYVFDRFQQADNSITRKHGGLGLGLAIARHLVEMHGGSIEAQSDGDGCGAIFTVRLPVSPAKELVDVSERQTPPIQPFKPLMQSPALTGVKILVVDDDADVRVLLHALLERCGADVTASSSASQAAEVLAGWNPDVVVCDIGMPEEDGYSFIRKIRQLDGSHGGDVPAIALTGYVRVEDRARALQAGYQMFVPKPVEAAEIISAIESLIGREHARRVEAGKT